jgi:hypothetical protein
MTTAQLTSEVATIARELRREFPYAKIDEALHVAARIQFNHLFAQAMSLHEGTPPALEAIAMELGAAKDGDTIKTALYNLRE